LVNIHLATGKIVDKLVREAVKRYWEGFGVPNRPKTRLGASRINNGQEAYAT